MVLREGLNMG